MKKLIALVASVIMAATLLTGCGVGSATGNTGWYNDGDKKGAEDNASKEMKKLVDKMIDSEGIIAEDAVVTSMDPVKQKVVNGDKEGKKEEYGGYLLLGAEEGYRFSYKYNESDVNLEIYRYDELNDTAKKTISDVKSKGEFTLTEEKEAIKAYLSKDEKFLLIYQDNSTDKKNKKKMDKAVDFIENYGADKKEAKDSKKAEKK